MKKISFTALLLPLLFFVLPAQAQISGELGGSILNQTQLGAGETEPPADPQALVIKIINVFLGLLGTVFVFLIIMSGYWFLTARGEQDKVQKAKDTLKRAILGLAIVLMAYSIVYFVSNALTDIVF
ncbi:hypothetical protein KKA94_04310 [Patescibacteria group bacterium]|nr:hypothetical protein [Patescibacteria group bacterium]